MLTERPMLLKEYIINIILQKGEMSCHPGSMGNTRSQNTGVKGKPEPGPYLELLQEKARQVRDYSVRLV